MPADTKTEAPAFVAESARLAFDKSNSIQPSATFDAKKLAGRSVVITGGANGIGEATVRAFVAAGAFVTFGDIAAEQGQSLVSELGADKVAFVPCDVLAWDQQLQLFKTALEKAPSKSIDVVCANAGIAVDDDLLVGPERIAADPTADPTEPKLSTFKVNAIGVAYTAKLAGHYLASRTGGEHKDRSLIITASLAGYLDMPSAPQYNASKWAVRGLFRSLRNTMPAQGIRVGLIAPWFIKTRIVPAEAQAKLDAIKYEWSLVEDAASAILHIAADESVNGRSLAVVPRSVDPRGYVDANQDNVVSGNTMLTWQINAGVRDAQ